MAENTPTTKEIFDYAASNMNEPILVMTGRRKIMTNYVNAAPKKSEERSAPAEDTSEEKKPTDSTEETVNMEEQDMIGTVEENDPTAVVLTKANMHIALSHALAIHRDNQREIHYLMNTYKGVQSILFRKKEVRDDINNKVVINYASSFTRDIIGYTFGKPMQYIARRSEDKDSSDKKDDKSDKPASKPPVESETNIGDTAKNSMSNQTVNIGDKTIEIEDDNPIKNELRLICDFTELADKYTSDQIKATTASICGISHRGVFMNKDYEDGDMDESPIAYMDLDPESTFVVYSPELGGKEVFAVTYVTYPKYSILGSALDGFTTTYTVYTPNEIYKYRADNIAETIDASGLVPGYPKPNPLGIIPIVENENNQFRMGHWETALSLMDAINKLASDSLNDVEQYVNAILVAINAEFDKETMESVKENKFASIRSPQGLNADLKYIHEQLDGASVEQLRQYLEDCLRVVVGIPDRKTRGGGGGDTGDAVKLRDGWADMEVVARTTEAFNKKSEKKELKIILKILKNLKLIDKISMINIDMKYPRNKTDNLLSKVQAMSTLHSMKMMAPEDTLEIGDVTTDITEVVQRGEAYWKNKAEQNFEDQQRLLKAQAGVKAETQEGDGNNADKSKSDSGKSGSDKSGKSADSNSATK